MQIVVDLVKEVLPVIAWLPRSALSLQLLEIAGVTLPDSSIPFPWKGHDIDPQKQQALVVDGVGPIRRLFRAALRESGQTEETGTNTPGADRVLTATNAALKQLPIKTEITAEVLRRLGQERFREALIDYWNGCCAVTGCSMLPLLKASHIKPWAHCTNYRERLDPFNGLLLSPNWDAAFDLGFVTFCDKGSAIVSPRLSPADREALGIQVGSHLRRWTEPQADYMLYHRRYIFQGSVS
jgi:hypothetical protein